MQAFAHFLCPASIRESSSLQPSNGVCSSWPSKISTSATEEAFLSNLLINQEFDLLHPLQLLVNLYRPLPYITLIEMTDLCPLHCIQLTRSWLKYALRNQVSISIVSMQHKYKPKAFLRPLKTVLRKPTCHNLFQLMNQNPWLSVATLPC